MLAFQVLGSFHYVSRMRQMNITTMFGTRRKPVYQGEDYAENKRQLNFVPGDRQKAPEIAPLFNAFQRAGPRPENSFLYLLGHIDLASIRASSAP